MLDIEKRGLKMKKGIYLASFKAEHSNYDIVYQDINGKRDLAGCMLSVDLSIYDYIIATPPCNYFSKARGNKKPSVYAENTKHLLPSILNKLIVSGKPFIVENVRNLPLFESLGLFNIGCFVYFHGRHTYWTNMAFNPSNILQKYDFSTGGVPIAKNIQGGDNVHLVIDYWLDTLHNNVVI